MGGYRGVLLGLGLLLTLPLTASAEDKAPKGPAGVDAPELGVSFEGPKDWYVQGHHSLLLKDGRWLFRNRTALMGRYFKETWAMYPVAEFCRDEEPAPHNNPTAWVAFIDWPEGRPLSELVGLMLKENEVLVEEYKAVAGPVADKLGGRKASTYAFKGRYSAYFRSKGTRSARTSDLWVVQKTFVALDKGVLELGFAVSPKEWDSLRPSLRAVRRSFKLSHPIQVKGAKRMGKGNDGDYSVGNLFYGH